MTEELFTDNFTNLKEFMTCRGLKMTSFLPKNEEQKGNTPHVSLRFVRKMENKITRSRVSGTVERPLITGMHLRITKVLCITCCQSDVRISEPIELP